MFSRDKWNEILQSLSSNAFRTVLTAFGVFWGIFILVILLSAANGLENGVKQGFSGIATNSMFMWSQTTSISYKGFSEGRRYSFKLDEVGAIKRNVDGIKYVSPRNRLGGYGGSNNVTRGLNTGGYNVYGDYPQIIKQMPLDIIRGRFINPLDTEQKRKVAVIGQGVQDGLYDKGEEVLGTYIKIQGVNFQVVGIYTKKGNNGRNPEEAQKEIYIPFTAFSQAFNEGQNVGWMAVTADDDHSITNLKQSVFDVIKQRHDIHPDDERAVGNFDLYEQFKKISGLFIALNAVAYIVGFLVLISGVIGITNIMLIVVKERTKEIGIRRALGATPWSIRGQILMESVFLTIIAGMTGIAFATGVIWVVNLMLEKAQAAAGPAEQSMFANPSVSLLVVVVALLILVGSGLLAGLIPAQNAIKIKPVDALGDE